MKKFYKWFLAHTTNRKYWRVKYFGDPRTTVLLCKSEAKGLAKIFKGVAYIDYKIK